MKNAMKAIDALFEAMPINLEDAKPIKITAGFEHLYDHFTWEAITFKECFNNAAMIALSKSDAEYCIGFANATGLPVEHAWVCINGKYYDPTWEKFAAFFGEGAYKLIRQFTKEELLEYLEKSGDYPPELWRMQHLAYLEKN